MTKVIIDNEKLEKLLEVISSYYWAGCPAEVFRERPSWCNEEYCINCDEYDCIKKWLGVKELPKPIQIPSDLPAYAHYTKGYDDGWNACIGEILGEEND